MAKKVAPPKSTGGGGYNFEDEVSAYFLSCLLTSRPPFEPELGVIQQIDFQTRSDGWFLDDILLTLKCGNSSCHCALSIKNSRQFTNNGAPHDFVRVAWEQLLHEGADKFQENQDFLGLISLPSSPDLNKDIQELLKLARAQDPEKMVARMNQPYYVSEQKRKLFKSFSCPSDLAQKRNIKEEDSVRLLKHIIIREQTSDLLKKEAHRNCVDALRSRDSDEWSKLLDRLLSISGEYRSNAGSLNLQKLLPLIKNDFRLKDYPEYDSDWNILRENSRNMLKSIPTKIGGTIQLPRTSVLNHIEAEFKKNKAVLLLGASGSGKTVITKLWAESHSSEQEVLWWDASDFETEGASVPAGLGHSLYEILNTTARSEAFVVIDGLDRLYGRGRGFRNISILLSNLNLERNDSPWKVLVTCQTEEWGRISKELLENNIYVQWNIVQIEEPSSQELNKVWERFPVLKKLASRSHLENLLFKPKILDLLTDKLLPDFNENMLTWVGESDLIEWFWKSDVENQKEGLALSQSAQLLAVKLADELRTEIPLVDCKEITHIDNLVKLRILKNTNRGISFDHDLYGDWARQRVLLQKASDLKSYLDHRDTSPLWHRAVRFLGLHLLEKNEDVAEWHRIFSSLQEKDESPNLFQDLLLESAIFAADSLTILERLWIVLSENNGVLLWRLLGRFIYSATYPDPRIVELVKTANPDFEITAKTMMRIPHESYWIPMLKFIYAHLMDMVNLAGEKIAEIADCWLRRGGKELRKEAAEIALRSAQRIIDLNSQRSLENLEIYGYRALLAAVAEIPDKTRQLILRLAGRIKPDLPQYNANTEKKELNFGSNSLPLVSVTKSWSDGPQFPVDKKFKWVCLEGDALYPLISSDPKLAVELILALLIKEPGKQDCFLQRIPGINDLSIDPVHQWSPAMYVTGPFLYFLKVHPEEGLDLIVRLINFATERWAENWQGEGEPPGVSVKIAGKRRTYLGDIHVYKWSTGSGILSSIQSALMALEWWLYDLKNSGEEIKDTLKLLLKKSNSLAVIGVLLQVGKRYPEYFVSILKPFLGAPQFYAWDKQQYLGGFFADYNQELNAWYLLPHRKQMLIRFALKMFSEDPKTRSFFKRAISSWEQDQDNTAKFLTLKEVEAFQECFNMKNYKKIRDDSGNYFWQFNPPRRLEESASVGVVPLDQKQLSKFIFQCNQLHVTRHPIWEGTPEGFWQVLQIIEAQKETLNNENFDLWAEDAISAGISVLICFYSEWLKQNPEKEVWCRERIIKIAMNPPKPHGEIGFLDNNPGTTSDFRWDGYCARALPILWAENLDSQELKRGMALLASHFRYDTVKILFHALAGVRDKTGQKSKELQHFSLRWAVVRQEWNSTSHKSSLPYEQLELRMKEIENFVHGGVSPGIPPWQELVEKVVGKDQSENKVESVTGSVGSNLDLLQVRAAFDWLPDLAEAKDAQERSEWIEYYKQALQFTLQEGKEMIERNIGISPSEWSDWLFQRIAKLILSLEPSEQPELFWKPILELRGWDYLWINEFLGSWFLNGLSAASAKDNFLREWKEMLEYAFSSPKWKYETGFYWRLDETWIRVMGFAQQPIKADLWAEQHRSIVRELKPFYFRWAERCLVIPRCAVNFMVFLQQPAAVEILCDGLIWLNDRSGNGSIVWNDQGAQTILANLLHYSLQYHCEMIRENTPAFEAFKNLLKLLSERQHPESFVLQEELAKGV